MQYARCDTAKEFLKRLNAHLCFEDGRIRKKAQDECDGQASLDLIPIRKIGYKKKVQLVVEGPCSSDIWRYGEHYGAESYPMGVCMKRAGEEGMPYRSWLHEMIKARDTHVLVFARCCGQYDQRYLELLRAAFREVTWMFPKIPDLCNDDRSIHNFERLADALVGQGIIGPAKK